MNKTKREFIINELMAPGFMEWEKNCILLQELEDTGKSVLEVHLRAEENLCIRNVDKKHTELQFFQKDKRKSMFKRVDHIIYEPIADNDWKVHLIEMKSWVGVDKWNEIKGKFRASYLLAQGIASMLEMNLVGTCLYTTYEKVDLHPLSVMPVGHRLPVGLHQVRPEDEWTGKNCGLNFGVRIPFIHKPVRMTRNADKILTGILKD